MKTLEKYEAKVYIDANKDDVKYIGTVKSNSIKGLKEAARTHARLWNNHLSGRLCLCIAEADREFFINPS